METWEKISQGAYMCWLLVTAVAIVVGGTTSYLISVVILILLNLAMEGEIFVLTQHPTTLVITSFYYKSAAILNLFGAVGLFTVSTLGVPTAVTRVVYIGLLLGGVLCVQRVLLAIKYSRIAWRSY